MVSVLWRVFLFPPFIHVYIYTYVPHAHIGMAISPLTFIAEWFAHDSAIVNVQTFVYQEPDAEVFVPDKEKQKGLTFDSLVSKNKTANNKGRSGGGGGGVNTTTATGEISDSDEDEDERQHRMMRAEIQRNMTEATTEHHYYNSNGNSGHSSGINSPHNPHISGSNSPTCASTNNGQQQSKKRSEPHGHRLMNSANKNTILKHYNGNSLVYNDDITTLVPDIDGFLVTSGKDQVVYLWSLVGELVGRVGGASWNISDMKTWGRGQYMRMFADCQCTCALLNTHTAIAFLSLLYIYHSLLLYRQVYIS